MQGTLSIVATPIGNLEDITLRALRVLKEADIVLCEDTRVTKKLLAHYDISVEQKRCDAEKEMECAPFVVTLLREGKRIAYVSDAGTPAVNDPGSRLVAYVRERLPEAVIEAVPGPSSLVAALSVSGAPVDTFTFLGFVPHKKGRKTFFESIEQYPHTVVFFESPHRTEKTLGVLRSVEKDDTDSGDSNVSRRKVTVVRELTKIHESVVTGTPSEVYEYFKRHTEEIRGEFVILVH